MRALSAATRSTLLWVVAAAMFASCTPTVDQNRNPSVSPNFSANTRADARLLRYDIADVVADIAEDVGRWLGCRPTGTGERGLSDRGDVESDAGRGGLPLRRILLTNEDRSAVQPRGGPTTWRGRSFPGQTARETWSDVGHRGFGARPARDQPRVYARGAQPGTWLSRIRECWATLAS